MATYLDENGNPVADKKAPIYLDANGEPRSGNPSVVDNPVKSRSEQLQEPEAKAQFMRQQEAYKPLERSMTAQPDFLSRARAAEDSALGNMVPGLDTLKQAGETMIAPTVAPVMQIPKMVSGAVDAYKGARTRGQGMGTSIAEGAAGMFGINPQAVEEHARQGDVAGVVGEVVPSLGATLVGGEVAEHAPGALGKIENFRTDVGAARNAEKLAANTRGRLGAAQTEATKAIENGREQFLKGVEQKTAAIKAADTAYPTKTLDADRLKTTLKQGFNATDSAHRLAMPTVAKASDLLDTAEASGPMTFERLQNLRSDLGRLSFRGNMSPAEEHIMNNLYGEASNMMAERANQLGMSDAFNKYNAEYHKLKELDTPLNKMLYKEGDPVNFWNTVNKDPITQRALDIFGKHGDVVRQIGKEAAPLQNQLAKAGQSTGFSGRMRALMEHPGWALAGSAAGVIPGKVVGMPWVGEMIGASKGADFGSRVATARALREGSPFQLGTNLINEGKGPYGWLPEQSPWSSGTMSLPEEPAPKMKSTQEPPKTQERRVSQQANAPRRRMEDVESKPMLENVNDFVNNAAAQDLFDKDYENLTPKEQSQARAHAGKMYSQEQNAQPIKRKLTENMPRSTMK